MSDTIMLGKKLRASRVSKGLSLRQVELRTNGVFKSSIVGAYERGERNLSIKRLAMLASFYDTTVENILAAKNGDGADDHDGEGVRIHLPSVYNLPGNQRLVIERFVEHIKKRRGDPASETLTLRHDDLLTIACVLGISRDTLARSMQSRRVTS